MEATTTQQIKTGDRIIMTGWNPRTEKHSTEYFVTQVTKAGDRYEFETVPEGGTNDGFGFYRFTATKGQRFMVA